MACDEEHHTSPSIQKTQTCEKSSNYFFSHNISVCVRHNPDREKKCNFLCLNFELKVQLKRCMHLTQTAPLTWKSQKRVIQSLVYFKNQTSITIEPSVLSLSGRRYTYSFVKPIGKFVFFEFKWIQSQQDDLFSKFLKT